MSRRKVLGVEVETDDLPDPDEVNTDAPGPAPGGFFNTGPTAGPGEAEATNVARIADSLEGIRSELAEIRKMLTRFAGQG
ncbi:hypothetical protein [Indioceanicola profundi]|uniref:hypothetical protein n=1 Tax=Indioceanicola profundi TaxID=2220096 RepID=UPI000E6AC541|nr:hypothetical protein [Indioceanicola profundi]